MELGKLGEAGYHAGQIHNRISAMTWRDKGHTTRRRSWLQDVVLGHIDWEFTQLAAALGYRVEKIKADEVAE